MRGVVCFRLVKVQNQCYVSCSVLNIRRNVYPECSFKNAFTPDIIRVFYVELNCSHNGFQTAINIHMYLSGPLITTSKDMGKRKGNPHKTTLRCYEAESNKAYKYNIFRRVRKIAKSDCWLRLLCLSVHPSVRLSVRPHGTTRLPLDGFSWKVMFEHFSKLCRECKRLGPHCSF